MKTKWILSALTCGLLLGATGLQAKTDKKVLVNNTMQEQIKQHKQAPKEVVAGMQQTFKALKAMQAGKKADAKKALEAATKSFETALKANPSLDLIPIDERFQAFSFMGSSDAIAARLKLAQQLLKAHDTQVANAVISPLKDELDITVISIPMKIYPVAAQKALEELNKGNDKAAFDAIAEAMNSLVVVKAIVPTPLLAAQDMIIDASRLDKKKKAQAKKLLSAAKEELKRAELLGYVSKNEAAYKLLNDDITKIQKEIEGKNVVEKLYDRLKNDFKKIIAHTKIAKKTSQQIAEEKVKAFEAKETKKAIELKDTFKQEAQQDEKKTIQ